MKELKLIERYYGDKTATRSEVPLINHIYEGIEILEVIGASESAKRAFCLHPIVQRDADLKDNLELLKECDGDIVALAMEYRHVANAYLSTRFITSISQIELGSMFEIAHMLIADKVQNWMDFEIHHRHKHPRSDELEEYFKYWFRKLGVFVIGRSLYDTEGYLPIDLSNELADHIQLMRRRKSTQQWGVDFDF